MNKISNGQIPSFSFMVRAAKAPGVLEGRNAIKETWQQSLSRTLRSTSWVDPASIKLISRTAIPVMMLKTIAPVAAPTAAATTSTTGAAAAAAAAASSTTANAEEDIDGGDGDNGDEDDGEAGRWCRGNDHRRRRGRCRPSGADGESGHLLRGEHPQRRGVVPLRGDRLTELPAIRPLVSSSSSASRSGASRRPTRGPLVLRPLPHGRKIRRGVALGGRRVAADGLLGLLR